MEKLGIRDVDIVRWRHVHPIGAPAVAISCTNPSRGPGDAGRMRRPVRERPARSGVIVGAAATSTILRRRHGCPGPSHLRVGFGPIDKRAIVRELTCVDVNVELDP